jgi:hypothetical protein
MEVLIIAERLVNVLAKLLIIVLGEVDNSRCRGSSGNSSNLACCDDAARTQARNPSLDSVLYTSSASSTNPRPPKSARFGSATVVPRM